MGQVTRTVRRPRGPAGILLGGLRLFYRARTNLGGGPGRQPIRWLMERRLTLVIRYSLKCSTCGQAHTVRIGMGQEEEQIHKFACRGCQEQIVVRLDVDYKEISAIPSCVENCEDAPEEAGAAIVNVDANFLVPAEFQGVDMVMPRVMQMMERLKSQEKLLGKDAFRKAASSRVRRRPAHAEEWKQLKKAWSLARNGKGKLSARKMFEASPTFYPGEPIDSLQDWLWRFALVLCNPGYEQRFIDALEPIKAITPKFLLDDFSKEFSDTASARGERYCSVMREFFAGYHEFGQVYFSVISGTPAGQTDAASSVDFDTVKMFYGNAFEHFASLIDYFSFANNIILGRKYDTFGQLTIDAYRKLDKPNKFNNFAMNPAFTAICAEADNSIRNASHHGSFLLGQDGIIRYRSGKGSMGPEQQMTYASYLERCVKLFLQVMTLLRIELVMTIRLPMKPPL